MNGNEINNYIVLFFKFCSYFSACITMKFLDPTLLTLDNHIVRPISKIKKYF